MKITRFSVRKLLLITAATLAIMLLFIGVVTNFFLKQSFTQFELLREIDRINSMGLRARSVEKDFMLKETVNYNFFETGKSQYIQEFDSLSREISKALDGLRSLDIIVSLNLSESLESTIISHENYSDDFIQATKLIRNRGLRDNGLIGEFRLAIHDVENQFNEMKNFYFISQMLMLRRHEKDYLLRKDLSYQKRFHSLLQTLMLEVSKHANVKNKEDLIGLLKTYGDIFDQLIDLDKQIGFNQTEGILGKLHESGSSVENGLVHLNNTIYDYSQKRINVTVATLFGFVAIISLVAVLLLLFVSRHIVNAIKRLQRYITRLGLGELPEEIEIRSKNEISQMELSINILSENLKKTRSFAIEVGNGNLESEVNVFGNKGDLGGALIEMRKKLLQVSKEREQQTIDTDRRMWANEGMAIFAEILRTRDKSMEDMAFEIIKNLVKYTKSNQAGIFLMHQETGEKPVLNLLAAYAWERKKFSKMQIEINEGLVGTCALEAETTLFTEIPKDYIRITSGLGDSVPTCLILVPMKVEGEVLGVIEMASFNVYEPHEIEFLEKVVANVASTLQMVKINNHTKQLLGRTQQQAEELQAQEEEMRQNMEEMQATQEWLNNREEELKNEVLTKDIVIEQLKEANIRESKKVMEKYSSIESIYEVFNSYFLIAELNKSGDILVNNSCFKKVISGNDGLDILNFFENSLPGEEDINRSEWSRIVGGETYRGIIHRLDAQRNPIAIQTVLSPVMSEDGVLDVVFFVGQKIGLIDEKISDKANGNWVKEFISASNILCENKAIMS